jgi:uncharacterized protein YigA (DUF484 family)
MTTTPHKNALDDTEFERQIVKFLRDHPDFFERHPELLADMTLPHTTGSAVSLIERQVSVLREQKEAARKKLQMLIANAQSNEKLNERLNSLTLALLDTETLEQVLDIVQQRLTRDFEADAVVVRLFNTGHPAITGRPELIDWSEPVLGAFEKVIRERRPVCGRLGHGQLDSLFSDDAGHIASAALVPLVESENSSTCYGMLAIGSHERDRFRPDMGTHFLAQFGKLLSRILKKYLKT